VSINQFLGTLTGSSYTLASFLGTSTVTAGSFTLTGVSGYQLAVVAGTASGTEVLDLVSGITPVFNGVGTLVATGTTAADWSTIANWTDSASVHGAPGVGTSTTDVAYLTDSGHAGVSTTVDLGSANPSLSGLTLSHSSSGFTIQSSGGGSLTLSAGSGTAAVTVATGSHTISAPVNLASDTALNVSANASLTFSGSLSNASSYTAPTMHVNGAGTVTLSGAFNLSNPGTINVNQGTLVMNAPAATYALADGSGTSNPIALSPSNVTVNVNNNASVYFAVSHQVNALNLNGTDANNPATVTLASATGLVSNVLVTNSLTIAQDGSGNYLGKLDIGNGGLIVNYAPGQGPSTLATIEAMVGFAMNSGNTVWGANGITSSAAANDPHSSTGIGVIDNAYLDETYPGQNLGPMYTTFLGQSVQENSILVRYTLYGDDDLSGQVGASEYTIIDAAYNSQQATGIAAQDWIEGNFDYSGLAGVGASEYSMIDATYNMEQAGLTPVLPDPVSGLALYLDRQAGVQVVPEPTTLALLAIGGVVGLASGAIRRRRQSRQAA
jgi:hypothetical protein